MPWVDGANAIEHLIEIFQIKIYIGKVIKIMKLLDFLTKSFSKTKAFCFQCKLFNEVILYNANISNYFVFLKKSK